MEHKGIKYIIKIKNNQELDDTITIYLIDKLNNNKIGHLTFKEINYFSDDWYIEPIEICNIIEEYEPMSLDYIQIEKEYLCMGFGSILMEYFIKNYVKNNICILLKCAYNMDFELKKYFNDIVLEKFYKKYGFINVPNTEYMVSNLY